MTPTQKMILSRDAVTSKAGDDMFPIHGSAEHRSCNSKAMRELGHVCSSQVHGGGYFFNTSKTADQADADFNAWLANRSSK